jgi:hypothetical protein
MTRRWRPNSRIILRGSLTELILLASVLSSSIPLNAWAQPAVHLPAALPVMGAYYINVHELAKPYFLTDTVGAELTWNLADIELKDPFPVTDSVLPWDQAMDDSLPEGTAVVLHRTYGYRRHYLNFVDGALQELGTYSPYYNEHEHYSRPLVLWRDGSGYGSYSEQYSPTVKDVMMRREVVGTGTLIAPFGRFPDLLLLKVWPDRELSAERYELVDPTNVLLPLGVFWLNGDAQLFEPAGYAGSGQ